MKDGKMGKAGVQINDLRAELRSGKRGRMGRSCNDFALILGEESTRRSFLARLQHLQKGGP